MITLDKWYPMVQPRRDIETLAFSKAAEKVQEENRQAVKANKIEKATAELEVELYNKKARVNQLELEMFKTRKLDLYA
jgi:predicted RNase H-like nuclease (RuvC/YqgF family)